MVDAVELIRSGKVHLVVNTPRGRGPRADGAYIRRAAHQYKVPLVTTVAAARAAAAGVLERAGSPSRSSPSRSTTAGALTSWRTRPGRRGQRCPGFRRRRTWPLGWAPSALPNPVMTASGTAGHGVELGAYFDLSAAGRGRREVAVGRALGRATQPPACCRWRRACSTASGSRTRGSTRGPEDDLPALARAGARIVVSVWGRSAGEYAEVGRRLAEALAGAPAEQRPPVVAVEANISCPNIEDRQRMFSHSAEGTAAAVGAAHRGALADGLAGMGEIEPQRHGPRRHRGRRPRQRRGRADPGEHPDGPRRGPCYGVAPPRRGWRRAVGAGAPPVAVRAVYECRRAFPAAAIVGVGGVNSGYDAAELLACGGRRCPGRHGHLRRPEGTAAGARRNWRPGAPSQGLPRASPRWSGAPSGRVASRGPGGRGRAWQDRMRKPSA